MGSTPRRAATAALIDRYSTRLARHVNEPLVEFFVVARRLCFGDLDAVLVLLVVFQRANQHPAFARLRPADLGAGGGDQIPSLPLNIQSIADSTGIPRETVRRKVKALVERGWVIREGGQLRLAGEGYRAVAPAREALIRLAARVADSVNALPN